MTAVTICSDFGAWENKICHRFHFFPIYLPWNDGTRCHDLCFLNIALSQLFHSLLSLSSIGSLVPLHFLPLEWYHLHMWGCWYFSWQSWFQLVLQPAQYFTWCTLHVSYTSMVTGLQPWPSPFPILNQSVVPYPVLTFASWPAYRFHRRQIRWSGISISLRIFHSLLGSTQSKALV